MGTNYMIHMMKRAAVLVALLSSILMAGSVGTAVAQQGEVAPEHLAIARKYVDLTDRVSIYEVTLVETAVHTMRTLLSQNPNMYEPVDAAITKTLDAYRGRKSELMDQFARLYALTFTIEELEQIVAFYESPVGIKLSTANATLNQDMQSIMEIFQVNLRQEFFAQVRANLREAGFNL